MGFVLGPGGQRAGDGVKATVLATVVVGGATVVSRMPGEYLRLWNGCCKTVGLAGMVRR